MLDQMNGLLASVYMKNRNTETYYDILLK